MYIALITDVQNNNNNINNVDKPHVTAHVIPKVNSLTRHLEAPQMLLHQNTSARRNNFYTYNIHSLYHLFTNQKQINLIALLRIPQNTFLKKGTVGINSIHRIELQWHDITK